MQDVTAPTNANTKDDAPASLAVSTYRFPGLARTIGSLRLATWYLIGMLCEPGVGKE